jgi:hypothetical protein
VSAADLIARHVADPQASWAIGTFGAIAEFQRDAGEAVMLRQHAAITSRGGIELWPREAVLPVAWECPAAGDTWTHGIAFCLPRAEGAMSGRKVVTEIGPDTESLREEERDAILFDLGVSAAHCDICVRTSDPEVLHALRAAAGQPLLETSLFDALRLMSPTRVFLSRLGRVEVRTPIPPSHGRTPEGPHTHVLRNLLKRPRTHSANLPLPGCLVPCAELFPTNAIHNFHGRRQQFDIAKHEAFQTVLAEHGDALCMKAKLETIAAVRAGRPPLDESSYTRPQRLARRVALRQMAQIDGPSRALAAWRNAFDSAPVSRDLLAESHRPRP